MLRTLIVDDDAELCERLVQSLKEHGTLSSDVVVVATADEAYSTVQHAEVPFDIILIDQDLSSDLDGIEVFKQLRALSPQSEALVFTAADDERAGMRAYLAGAYSYLPKPFSIEEFLFILTSLCAWRDTRNERDWLKIFAEITRAAQKLLPVQEVGQIIVESSQRFGFERARLWLLDSKRQLLIGLNQVGNQGLEQFSKFEIPVSRSAYIRRVLAGREPYIFRGQEFGLSYLSQAFGPHGFQVADGDWVGLPLCAGECCVGLLLLDNYSQPRHIGLIEQQQLALFANLVAAALERAQLYEQEQRARQKLEVLTQIGRHISGDANLVDLIADMPMLLRPLMPVSSIGLALYSEQTGRQDLLVADPEHPRNRRMPPEQEYLLNEVIVHNAPLVSDGHNAHSALEAEHQDQQHPHSLLAVPLRVKEETLGAILVQSSDQLSSYTREHVRTLIAVAEQIGGAILTMRLKEKADRTSARLSVLQHVSETLIKVAEERDEYLWHATLTAITAGYAVGFNRAMLFLTQSGSVLRGELGIGDFTSLDALASWRNDREEQLTFDQYLEKLKINQIQPMPLSDAVRELVFDIQDDTSALGVALRDLHRVIVPEDQVHGRLPSAFVKRFGRADYVVFPMFVGTVRLGLIVVDNIHNKAPVQNMLLDEVETLLAQTALIYENKRQREASLQLIKIGNTVLRQVLDQSLQQALTQICEAALVVAGADCVVIYPILPNASQAVPGFDLNQTGTAGLQHDLLAGEAPQIVGSTLSELRQGRSVTVPDVASDWSAPPAPVQPSFLTRENIRSFMALPILDQKSRLLIGALYLNYRMTRTFDAHDLERAQSIATLSGDVIHISRAGELWRRRGEVSQHELETLSHVMEQALTLNLGTEQRDSSDHDTALITTLLKAAQAIVAQQDARVGLLLREWARPVEGEEPKEVRRQYFLFNNEFKEKIEPELKRGITGRVFETGEGHNVDDVTLPKWSGLFYREYSTDTRSELDVPIELEGYILGMFNIESPHVNAFSDQHFESMKRLARVAMLALDNFYRQENLRKVAQAARSMVAPSNLDRTFQAVQDMVLSVAPGISALTIWYREPGTNRVMLWPGHFGVRSPVRNKPAELDSPVWEVIRSSDAIFATHVAQEPRFGGRFITEQQIKSVAALPLEADDLVVGALFFNYRSVHEFTSQERVLFPIIATVAAASVRDALRLEEVQGSKKRLDLERTRLKAAIQLTEAVGTDLHLDETLRKILTKLRKLLGKQLRMCVMEFDESSRTLTFTKASVAFYNDAYINAVAALQIDGEESIAAKVARDALAKRRFYRTTRDVTKEPRYLRANESTRSQMSLALMSLDKQKLLGVLILESEQLNAFTPEEAKLIWTVGRAISIALERVYTSSALLTQQKELRSNTLAATAMIWASELAHDVKGEMGLIRNRAYWLEHQQQLSEEGLRWVREIRDSVVRLASAANAPRSESLEKLPLDSWLTNTMRPELLKITAKRESQVEVKLDLGCSGLHIMASPIMLDRALRHLARNAVEAMGKQGVLAIQTKCLNSEIVQVQVIDTGPGIPEEIQQQLFNSQFSTKGDDRGLGLIVVRAVVTAMGGTLRMSSDASSGTVFAFELPVHQTD